MTLDELPKPRLQLRWRKPTADECKETSRLGRPPDWICDYEMVLPLAPSDIRRDDGHQDLVIEIGSTSSRTSADVMTRAPFRDGCHALWDSKALGGLPIFVIGSDGQPRPHLSQADR
jgi:hypothetical protein